MTLDTLYYRRRISPDKIEETLQAHSEGMSLRGISRQTKFAYDIVVAIIRDAIEKAQLVHNDALNRLIPMKCSPSSKKHCLAQELT